MRKTLAIYIVLATSAGALAAETSDPKVESFRSLCQKIQTDPGGATERDARQLLALGREVGRPYTASLAVKGYLSHHARPSPPLLLMAAENALWAGDYRVAVSRYKAYLRSAGATAQASDTAAVLYTVLIDLLGDHDGAYQFMTQFGDRFRARPGARRFDSWYAQQARLKRDYASLARFLAGVLADKMPLEKERLFFWHHLDWLMQDLAHSRKEQYQALAHCRKLVGLIRDSKRRTLRYGFYVANLAFNAGSAGKEADVLESEFEQVLSSAKAYFDAFPTVETLKDIVYTFAGGPTAFSTSTWQHQQAQKQKFFVYAFGKLSDNDRAEALSWSALAGYLATREQWTDLGLRHAAQFARCDETRRVPFVRRADKAEVFRNQARFLRGVPSYDAAVINSLAAGGDDLVRCVDHLVRNETWHLGYNQVYQAFASDIWPVFKKLHAGDKERTSNAYYARALIRLGAEGIAKSPAAMYDPAAVAAYLGAVWNSSENKGDLIKHLGALEWVPWSATAHKAAVGATQNAFRKWAQAITRESRKRDSKVKPGDLKQISPIAAAFKRLADLRDTDARRAPNALCGAVAQTVIAAKRHGRLGTQFANAARPLYKLVAEYDVKRTPGGRAAMAIILEGENRHGVRNVEFMCEILADQIAKYRPGRSNARIEEVISTILSPDSRGLPRTSKTCKQLNAVFEKAMLAQLARGRFWPTLFTWFRTTRSGYGWKGLDWGEAVMAKVLERQVFHRTSWRPIPGVPSATVTYMHLIRNEFPKLNSKYPVETYFDDLFVQEATRTGFLDWRYWDFGRDEKKKAVNAAAKILQGHRTLPFGYNGEKVTQSRTDFWNWQARAFDADKPVRDAMMAKVESCYGKTRFDAYAMGRQYFTTLADASTEKGRKEYFDRLARFLDRAAEAPSRLSLPYLGQLTKLDPKTLSKQELGILVNIFPHRAPAGYGTGWNYEKLPQLISQALMAQDRQTELYPLVPHFWKIARDTRDSALMRALVEIARKLLEKEHYDLAHVLASQGLDQHRGVLSGELRNQMMAVRSKALSEIGGVIPVRKGDPRYPIFAAQANYLTGTFQRARELYMANRIRTLGMFKDLDARFCIWLIEQDTEIGEYEFAETFARTLSQWFESVGRDIEPELRAQLQLAFADVFFARQEYPIAGARYKSIAAAKEFAGTLAQPQAELKLTEVYRLTKRYDLATSELEKLAQRLDRPLQAQAYYQLALVNFDQEEYREARQTLERVFAIAPDHADARILEGKVFLKLKRVELATEIEAGTPTRRNFLVPGTPLAVTLVDPNLSILGASTSVELRAWADSGDEELFSLTPFGESKTKFRGKLPTALAPVAKGDGALQVLGIDKVHFDFSEAFKKAHQIVVSSRHTLTVVTDGEVLASSSTILTKAERERLALEQLIRQRLRVTEEPDKQDVALSTLRAANHVKPGNPINVRVIDPDRSRTAKADKIPVKVVTSSGDSIAAFLLVETDTHSGQFEGAVPTASGQATAYASDTEDGKDANFALSSKEYGPWVAQADNVRPKTFSVDLNDNVALGKMNVLANVTLRKLTRFVVQTSLNGRDFTTMACWPKKHQPWDGSLRMELVRFAGAKEPRTLEDVRQYLEMGHVTAKQSKFIVKGSSPSIRLDSGVAGQASKMGLGSYTVYVAHLSGAFHQPMRRTRTFQLAPKDGQEAGRSPVRYFLAVDGQAPRRAPRAGEPAAVTLSLGKGAHRVDVYVVAPRNVKAAADLMWDIDEAPYMAVCPADAFDVAKHPEIRKGIYRDPGEVTADADGASFDVKFPEETNARVIRLLLLDFETDAPAISKIALNDAEGRAILPIKQDFMTLRKNRILEIVPGDKITITYQDPTVLTPGKQLLEASLTATYRNATISACFVEYQMSGSGERRARYVPMRRFGPEDKIQVFINDPDMDVSAKLDTVKFTARTTEGQPVELVALETEKHSGVFLGGVFPVSGQPKRKSELTVKPGDDVIVTYMDGENTDPGIPWERACIVEQVWFKTPEMWVYHVKSEPVDPQDQEAPAPSEQAQLADEDIETVPASRRLIVTRPEKLDPAAPPAAIIGGPCVLEVIFPTIAKSPESTAAIYVQTSSGRKAYGKPIQEGEFDINVPGTIELEARPGEIGRQSPPPGYTEVVVENKQAAILSRAADQFSALDDGRFSFSIPMELGKVPGKSAAIEDKYETRRSRQAPKLQIKGDDEVFIGFKYADKAGQPQWLTQRVVLDADAFFHVTDRRYQNQIAGLYVGQKAYFRVIDPRRDTSDKEDPLTIELTATSGTKQELRLLETFKHSGAFKGLVSFTYAGVKGQDTFESMPVKYGDTVTATYRATGKDEAVSRQILIFKGSDGLVLPFSKRFKDASIAMQTQFMVAEAYLELAKRHRELGEDSAARREIAQGKKLLEEAIRDYPQTEARAQTEYLLADLALEFANDAKNETMREKFYDEAINRFSNIVASYPDSQYAPKAQYKKALTLEKMNKFDAACEEYVKLSYRYPGNELVAETIARLGQYFMVKGKGFREQAAKETDEIKREATHMKARKMFKTAGQVLGRLGERFPNHQLAGKTSVLSAQCFMYAEEYSRAIEVFEQAIRDTKLDPQLVAEAMYWCADSYLKLPAQEARKVKDLDPARKAYQLFKRLDWDFPTTKWARFARGRLAIDERFQQMDE